MVAAGFPVLPAWQEQEAAGAVAEVEDEVASTEYPLAAAGGTRPPQPRARADGSQGASNSPPPMSPWGSPGGRPPKGVAAAPLPQATGQEAAGEEAEEMGAAVAAGEVQGGFPQATGSPLLPGFERPLAETSAAAAAAREAERTALAAAAPEVGAGLRSLTAVGAALRGSASVAGGAPPPHGGCGGGWRGGAGGGGDPCGRRGGASRCHRKETPMTSSGFLLRGLCPGLLLLLHSCAGGEVGRRPCPCPSPCPCVSPAPPCPPPPPAVSPSDPGPCPARPRPPGGPGLRRPGDAGPPGGTA